MNRLRQIREKNEMLQRDVANFLGISTSAYGFYETGARSMSAETAKKLAKFFKVSVDYLLGADTNNKRLLPVLGTVKAGYNYLAQENVIDYIDPSMNIADPENYFGLIVKGDSMSPTYLDGDTLILEKVEDCENGQDAVVMINGNDGTFKRVFKNENGIILQPLNPEYQPLVFSNEQILNLPVKIIGVAREIRRKI